MANLKALIGKLNDTCRQAFESAAGLCLSRTNYEVDIEHVLLKFVEAQDTDVGRILRHFGVDRSRLSAELIRAIDGFKVGNARTPTFSPQLPKWISEAWVLASVDYGAPKIRSGHMLLALVCSEERLDLVRQHSREIALVSSEALRQQFAGLVAGSPEAQDGERGAATGATTDGSGTAGQALDRYTIDLTDRARKGAIDPVVGRDFEIRQMIDILMRRRQNNPILTGEAGVGKTAVVEGFALRVAQADVPPPLREVTLRALDMGLLQAGAGVRGEFENRLKSVIEGVKAHSRPIILFIDEAHTLIGAGGAAGQNDAANLLKPALARGELRTIAATTWSEYKKYFEKDAALARRFQVVKIDEPRVEQAVEMMRYLTPRLEQHHGVRILDEAVEAAVRLSDRYISGRQLPDKAVSVLDTACARLAISHTAVPGAVEDARRRLAALDLEMHLLEREQATADCHQERVVALREVRQACQRQLEEVETRWTRERQLIEQIRTLRKRLEDSASARPGGVSPGQAASGETASGDLQKWRAELEGLTAELRACQGERPLMQVVVDTQTIGDVVSGWTGIPVGKITGDELKVILSLRERLEQRVLGQTHALDTIAQRIQISRARIEDPRKPVGVFLLVGPSGVGKTETALALADTLYGGEQNLITINMSEYQEAHTVSTLRGSPPGYVGYGEGGVLTEAVRRKPYSVVLLDEVEKAHPDVLELFYQVFDKGMLEDGEGREIDFKNTVILLTSNVGTEIIMRLCADEEARPGPDALVDAVRPELLRHFPAAFLGRLVVVPYYRISDAILRQIIELQMARLRRRIEAHHHAEFSYDGALVDAIRARCTEVESGARNVEHILMRTLLPEISRELLARMAANLPLSSVHITAGPEGPFEYVVH